MTEPTGNTVLGGDAEPDLDLTEPPASEETDSKEKLEQEDGQRDGQQDGEQDGQRDGQQDGEQDGQRDGQQDGEQDGQRDGQQDGEQDGQRDGQQDGEQDGQRDGQQDGEQDGQRDGQQDGEQDGQRDGQPVHPPAAETSSTESKWVVGAPCRAVWSEDGQVYPATVVSLDGERCRVRFNGYGNQEDVELSALESPDAAPQTQNAPDWKPGSRCRAVYSEDSLVYPAVILWVKGQRCRVRFDEYNNEEELDVGSLLHCDELHGPSRATAAKGSRWKSSGTGTNLDWNRGREENRGDRGRERRSPWRDEEQNSSRQVKEKTSNPNIVEKEAEEKKRGDQAQTAANHSFPFFPLFLPPPPAQSSSGDPVSFIPPPPPPPLWSFAGSTAGADSSNMLWYISGFHTGSYMAQQWFMSNSKD